MKNDPDKLRAALAKLEATRDLREAAKVPANGMIRMEEADGRVWFLVTGVPRADSEYDPPAKSDTVVSKQEVVDFPVNHIPDDPPPRYTLISRPRTSTSQSPSGKSAKPLLRCGTIV